ncbi:MAG: PhzF family phenazine biosynthesis protein [Pseudomonadota bacterium]
MQIHQLLCFGRRPGTGNAALVVERGPAGSAERQAFATAQNKSACVFLDASDDAHAPWLLDYYYPHAQSPLCLHASLACAHVLFAQAPAQAGGHLAIRTRLRGQLLALHRRGGALFVGLHAQSVPAVALAPHLPAALFHGGIDLVAAPVLASVGSPKLLLEVAGRAALDALAPDLPAIMAWGRAHGVGGCYVYCRVGEGEYAGRNFNHLDPAAEDSATGVAAGALSLHLGRALTLYQGSAQPCVMHTSVEGDSVLVGGATEIVAFG